MSKQDNDLAIKSINLKQKLLAVTMQGITHVCWAQSGFIGVHLGVSCLFLEHDGALIFYTYLLVMVGYLSLVKPMRISKKLTSTNRLTCTSSYMKLAGVIVVSFGCAIVGWCMNVYMHGFSIALATLALLLATFCLRHAILNRQLEALGG